MSLLLQLNLLVILVLFSILLSWCLIVSPQFLNLAFYLFAIFEELETLDFSTARTIATSLIHSKLDFINSLFLNFPQYQLGRLQFILNSSARAVSKTPKFAHISPGLKSPLMAQNWAAHPLWSRFYNLQSSSIRTTVLSPQPSQCSIYRTTRSSDVITPSVRSRLKLTDRSFTHHAPVLWNSVACKMN